MSKYSSFNFSQYTFWTDFDPNVSLDDISNKCFDPYTVTVDSISRSVPCGVCQGCVMRRKREVVSNMIMESYTCGLDNCIFASPSFDKESMLLSIPFADTLSKNLRKEYLADPHAYFFGSVNRSKSFELFKSVYFHPDGVLSRRIWDLYLDRLRKRFSAVKLRFYYAAEYGKKTDRPHYHVIIYGLPSDLVYTSDFHNLMDDIWGYGHVDLRTVHEGGFAYVAGYTLKKLQVLFDSISRGVPPEFQFGSSGLGFNYIDTSIIPVYVKRNWIPPNVGSMESSFIIKYFADRFNGLTTGVPFVMINVSQGRSGCVPTDLYLSTQKSKRPVPFGVKSDMIRTLYFDKVRQARIFNGVLSSLGLMTTYNKCVHELHHSESLLSLFRRWCEANASSTVSLQEQISRGDIPVPADRIQAVKLASKFQRKMDLAD